MVHTGPSPPCAIVASFSGALDQRPRPFAWSGKGRVDGAIRTVSFGRSHVSMHLSTDAFSASRMRTPLLAFEPSRSLDRARVDL